MDVDPLLQSSAFLDPSNHFQTSSSSSLTLPVSSPTLDNGHTSTLHPSQTLRVRPSQPVYPISPVASSGKPTSPVVVYRKASHKELNNIYRRLGPEGLAARRDELLEEKETELKGVVEGHDDAVREKFHLEKFISLLEGWDPEVS